MRVTIDDVDYVPVPKSREANGTLGSVLRECRQAARMSLDEASRLAGCSKSYLWSLENDNSQPGLGLSCSLACTYNVSLDLFASCLGYSPLRPNTRKSGIQLIAEERQRQITDENWTPEHDDEHNDESLAQAAACYATPPEYRVFVDGDEAPQDWPWEDTWWKPAIRTRELAKAGALIAAEIDRLRRQAT